MFEQWSPVEDQSNGDQQSQWESDEKFLLQFDSLIDSDIKELYNRYKGKGDVNHENDYRLEDSVPSEILIRELNGSRSTLNSTVSSELLELISICYVFF